MIKQCWSNYGSDTIYMQSGSILFITRRNLDSQYTYDGFLQAADTCKRRRWRAPSTRRQVDGDVRRWGARRGVQKENAEKIPIE